jgi:hypothetical protein
MLIKHKQMVWEVSELGLEFIPIWLLKNQLVHSCVAIYIYTIIVGVN